MTLWKPSIVPTLNCLHQLLLSIQPWDSCTCFVHLFICWWLRSSLVITRKKMQCFLALFKLLAEANENERGGCFQTYREFCPCLDVVYNWMLLPFRKYRTCWPGLCNWISLPPVGILNTLQSRLWAYKVMHLHWQGRRTQYGKVLHSPYLDSAMNRCNDS